MLYLRTTQSTLHFINEIIKHSPYYNDHNLNNLFLKKGNIFNILSLNSQSINAKFDQINIKLQELKNNGYEFSAICLQETWLTDNSDTSHFMINGYSLISQGKICTAHGGLAIYLCNKYDYNSIKIYQNSQVWEGQFIEIIGKQLDKKVILGNIYRPPGHNNETCQTFINEFIPLLDHLQKCKSEVIIAGDYNIDLLQIKENGIFGKYLDSVVAQGFFPKITLPTRLSSRNCTLIDNFLCKLSHGFSQATAGVLINTISDHLPYFIFLDYLEPKRVDATKLIRIQTWNTKSLNKFK